MAKPKKPRGRSANRKPGEAPVPPGERTHATTPAPPQRTGRGPRGPERGAYASRPRTVAKRYWRK